MPITPESLEESWNEIRPKIAQAGGSLILEQALIHGEVGLSAAVRVRDGMQGIILRVPARWNYLRWQVQRLTGVHFESVVQDRNDRLLPVMLADADAAGIFAIFAADLASALLTGCPMEEKMRELMDKVGLWRRFFLHRSGELSEEEVRGLVGELEFLRILVRNHGADAAMESWKGPRGELHDFHLPSFRIEVKTWINESLPRIFISNPSQIVIDSAWPVWIASLQLSRDHTAGSTLPARVRALAVGMNSAQRTIFEALLADVGYLTCHEGLYAQRYSVRDTIFYRIVEGFPLIDSATIPAGITCLKYALELGALAPFATSSPIGE